MKRIFIFLAFVAASIFARAAYLENVPTTLVQPNGDTLFCLQTGDEVYHRLHDDLGFTILQDPTTGFYVYARRGEGGRLVSSGVVAHSFPQARRLREMGIEPGLMPPAEELRQRAKGFDIPARYRKPEAKSSSRNRGTLNNLVIFIRFADEAGMGGQFSQVEPMFNDSSATSTSQYAYFRQASYGQLSIVSHFYPQPQGNTIVSYQDSMPRAYFSPYDAQTNPIGYTDRYDGRERALLQRCINWLNANNVVPSSLNLDFDNDGYVDNVVFVVSGTYTGWSDILWPHKWSLYDRYCYLNGKRVYTFNLQLIGSGSHYFSSSTLCHEMFHTLGAPDLYRYYDNSGVSTAGSWDLMHSNSTPPQHMSAWMKLIYGNWLDSIQDITAPGTYTLASLADQNPQHPRAYAIPSQDPNQYWILEYRNASNRFETTLPGSGLLIWRADTRYDGNASFDTTNYLDGLYLMRPGGTNMVTNGNDNQAHFGQHVGRSTFAASTNPSPWLNPAQPCATCFGVADTTIAITNIQRSADGSSLSFTLVSSYLPPAVDCHLTVAMADTYGDGWNGSSLSLETPGGELFGTATIASDSHSGSATIGVSGDVVVRWNSGSQWDYECSFTILGPAGDTLFAVPSGTSSSSNGLASGILTTLTAPCAPAILPDTFLVALAVNDPRMGTTSGAGRYAEGSTATLTATSFEGYRFLRWNDGVADSVRAITVTRDTAFTAHFEAIPPAGPDTVWYTLSVEVLAHPEHGGWGIVTGAGTYPEGTEVTLEARPEPGCALWSWDDGTNDETRVVTLLSDTTLTATFGPMCIGIDPAQGLRVEVQGRTLRVEGATGLPLTVSDLLGRLAFRTERYDGHPLALPHSGLYLLRVEGFRTEKILIK